VRRTEWIGKEELRKMLRDGEVNHRYSLLMDHIKIITGAATCHSPKQNNHLAGQLGTQRNLLCFYWYRWQAKTFSTPLLFHPFFKISSFSCLIFYYKMFSGGFLLSHNMYS
jgi:hypothetical protein